MSKEINILGIETSCDETAAAVVCDGKVIKSSVVASQIKLHEQYGGVVPEVASRAHIENIYPVVSQAIEQSGIALQDIDAIAKAAAAKLWTLADELDKATPARARDLFQRFVSRVELRFDHVQRGKRLECPFASGEIHLNPDMFPIVSRGDWI